MGLMSRAGHFASRAATALSKRRQFDAISAANGLRLNFDLNRSEIETLRSVFQQREYSDWFPFHEEAHVLDIGAHFGYFSIFASKNLAPGSRVVAVEPSARNYAALIENVRASGLTNVDALHAAVGGSIGQIELMIGDNVNNTIVADTVATGPVEVVDMVTIESILSTKGLDHIDFLKIDCEGAEYAIFAATPKDVFDRITTISMEFHDIKSAVHNPNWLAAKFSACGFQVRKLHYSATGVGKNYGNLIATKLLG